jgi:hypothetical protein
LEFTLSAEEAKRWQMNALFTNHIFMEPLMSTSSERTGQDLVPPVFNNIRGVLAGTANHCGFFPHIKLYFERGRLIEVKGGGRYGKAISDLIDEYSDIHWPGYPDKGYFWFCDCALCTNVKAFRMRTKSPSGGQGLFVVGNYYGHLSNWGETVNLFAADGTLKDKVMEREAAKVGRRGVVVIPSSFRKKYGFKEGSLIVAEARGEGVLLQQRHGGERGGDLTP